MSNVNKVKLFRSVPLVFLRSFLTSMGAYFSVFCSTLIYDFHPSENGCQVYLVTQNQVILYFANCTNKVCKIDIKKVMLLQ